MSYITYEVLVYSNGTQFWKNSAGLLHREDGPAIVRTDGNPEWFKDGKRHREDGPAIIHPDGDQFWYKDGLLHREDGPAVIYYSGIQYWYKDGKLHREDGPAAIFADGYQAWYLDNVKLTEQEFLERTQPAKELTVAEIEALLGHRVKVVKD